MKNIKQKNSNIHEDNNNQDENSKSLLTNSRSCSSEFLPATSLFISNNSGKDLYEDVNYLNCNYYTLLFVV
jgi:hypothetical protein